MNDPKTLKVLLVEDSPVVAERLRESLRELPGVSVLDTVDRESVAVDKLSHGGIDVVILDLHLNRGTGFGVLRAIKDHEPEEHSAGDPEQIDGAAVGHSNGKPVAIILTNYDLPEYRRQALALGADHFLDKSRDFDRLPELLVSIRGQRGGNGASSFLI